jgi:hypothetical protein
VNQSSESRVAASIKQAAKRTLCALDSSRHLFVSSFFGERQRRIACGVAGRGFCFCVEQNLHRLRLTCGGGADQGGGSPFATGICVGTRCEQCHNEVSWAQSVFFEHDISRFPLLGLHATLACEECHSSQQFRDAPIGCLDCHTGNNGMIPWRSPTYQPDCAGCHESEYKRGPHKKHETPDVKCTVSELRDCGGSCHVYTNSPLSNIKDRRNRQHRTTDSSLTIEFRHRYKHHDMATIASS